LPPLGSLLGVAGRASRYSLMDTAIIQLRGTHMAARCTSPLTPPTSSAAISGPDTMAASPSQNETTCQAVPNRPSRRNTSGDSMAATGSPIAPGMLKTECSRPVAVTSTQPASQGKNPTTTMPAPASTSSPVASVLAQLGCSSSQ
jgi:hypothetical protein